MVGMQTVFGRLVTRREVCVLAISILMLAVLSFAQGERPHFVSSEVRFTDASVGGLAIIPASCPSSPHYLTDECNPRCFNGCLYHEFITFGNCIPCPDNTPDNSEGSGSPGDPGGSGTPGGGPSCTPSVTCVSPTQIRQISASCVTTTTTCPSGWLCSSGACYPPPAIDFAAFDAYDSGTAGAGGSFTATGHLQVRPALVRVGDPVHAYWNVANAASCTVTGDNGDIWNTSSSGEAGAETSPIEGRTTFILFCEALPGATPTVIEEKVVVSVVPVFQEI